MSYLNQDRSGKSLLDYIIIIIFLFTTIFPIYWILTLSLKNQVDSFTYPPTWIFRPIADNYVKLFAEESFFKYLINSLVVSLLSVGWYDSGHRCLCSFTIKNTRIDLLLLSTSIRMIPMSYGTLYYICKAWTY